MDNIQRNDYVERLFAKTHYKSSALADDLFVKKYSKLLRICKICCTFAADLCLMQKTHIRDMCSI